LHQKPWQLLDFYHSCYKNMKDGGSGEWRAINAPYNSAMAAAMSSAIIWRLTFSMKKLGPACT
jgi:hypothetical protein